MMDITLGVTFLALANALGLYVLGGPHIHKLSSDIFNTVKTIAVFSPVIYLVNVFYLLGSRYMFNSGATLLSVTLLTVSINFICIVVISNLFHNEGMSIRKAIGILMIIGGSYATSIH